MPQTSGRSASSFARGSGHEGGVTKPMPLGRAEPAEHQYQGILRGLGTTSKEPICSKRASSIKRLHDATHFAIGCMKWDTGAAGPTTSQETYGDPQVVYATCDPPDRNMSMVEFQQHPHDPVSHYLTEQRDRFADRGLMPREPCLPPGATVHFGDDTPELVTQTKAVHVRMPDPQEQRANALAAAGAGTLIPNSVWPQPIRCNPITGGPRNVEVRELGVENGIQFGRITQNHSAIIEDHNHRNPILGHHTPVTAFNVPHMRTTADLVSAANGAAPPLRSLGALRPPSH